MHLMVITTMSCSTPACCQSVDCFLSNAKVLGENHSIYNPETCRNYWLKSKHQFLNVLPRKVSMNACLGELASPFHLVPVNHSGFLELCSQIFVKHGNLGPLVLWSHYLLSEPLGNTDRQQVKPKLRGMGERRANAGMPMPFQSLSLSGTAQLSMDGLVPNLGWKPPHPAKPRTTFQPPISCWKCILHSCML